MERSSSARRSGQDVPLASEVAARVVHGQAGPVDEVRDVEAVAVAAGGSPPAQLDEPSLREVAETLVVAETDPVPTEGAADEQRG